MTAIRDALASKVRPYLGNLVASLEGEPAPEPRQEWLRLAPRPRPLGDGLRWHAYISYRSMHRTWVLQLYDVLHTLGYEVFLDQLVLTPGADLVRTLHKGMEQSAAALLVWSSAFEDAMWAKFEYQALMERERNQKDFHFIVATLDKAPLPPMLAGKVYVDFSESREGPSGTPLLQLLYGLQRQPLPREAVFLAAQIDEEVRSSVARIQAARSVGDAERLSALAGSEGQAWHASPTLLCRVAEALIALRETDRALAVLEQCRRRFPKAIRPRQLLGLALARKGNWQEAQIVLEELYSSGERDAETVGILARTWMDRYRVTGDRHYLQRSRDLYAEAFAAAPDDYYVGINSASKSVLLGEMERARAYAHQVAKIVGTTPTGDYWRTVTGAEVHLILGEFNEAAGLYRAGIAEDPRARGSHLSTYDQARLLLDAMQTAPPDRETVLSAFGDVAAQEAATAASAGSRTPLTAVERTLIANLLFQLVALRMAAPDLLLSLDPGRFWEAVRKARPRAAREDLPSVAQTVTGPGRPSRLWLAWMQTVRARDLDRLVES